jgi:hypothetical protein
MRRVHNIEPTVTMSGMCHVHSNGHMDMFHAKYRNSALPGMCIPRIRWDTNRSQIRIEISASKICGHTRRNSRSSTRPENVEPPLIGM